MNIYARHLGPRIVHWACSMPQVMRQRRVVVPEAEGVVVEFGVGSGLNLPLYDRGKVSKVFGLNPDDGFAEVGDLAGRAEGLDYEHVTGTAEAAPFGDAFADSVVVTYTFCSIPDVRAAMAEARRILKPGGRLFLSEHGRSDRTGVARWQDRIDPLWKPLALGCHINRDHQTMLKDTGFDVSGLRRFDLLGAPAFAGHHHQGVLPRR